MMIANTRRGRCGGLEKVATPLPISVQRKAVHNDTRIGNVQSARVLTVNAAKTSEAITMNVIVSRISPIATPRRARRSNRRAPPARVAS